MISELLPEGFLGAFSDDPADLEVTQRFCEELAARGLLTVAWPVEYGGRGGTVWEQTVVREEMWANHEPRGAQYMGLNWVGPAIMQFGSQEQKDRLLPPIATGQVVWCQGFSEPNAGSDLASLQTRAVREADGWRIDGQKIWTSYAQMAQFCMAAIRTSVEDRPQKGISLFMIPMDRAGIEVRPIRSMIGPHHLNEVFFTDVRASDAEVLGEVGNGWSVIRFILAHERVGIARYARCDRLLNEAILIKGDDWSQLPKSLRTRFAKAVVHNRVARLLTYRVVDEQSRGQADPAAAAVARVYVTRADQECTDLLMEILGTESMDGKGRAGAVMNGAVEDYWRYAQSATIASGALEIQQLIIAKALLGSDDGPRTP
jgi:alkylation response protein AidB-like acyl-CoA dehydrogenase